MGLKAFEEEVEALVSASEEEEVEALVSASEEEEVEALLSVSEEEVEPLLARTVLLEHETDKIVTATTTTIKAVLTLALASSRLVCIALIY